MEVTKGVSRNHKLKYLVRLNELINTKNEVTGELHEPNNSNLSEF